MRPGDDLSDAVVDLGRLHLLDGVSETRSRRQLAALAHFRLSRRRASEHTSRAVRGRRVTSLPLVPRNLLGLRLEGVCAILLDLPGTVFGIKTIFRELRPRHSQHREPFTLALACGAFATLRVCVDVAASMQAGDGDPSSGPHIASATPARRRRVHGRRRRARRRSVRARGRLAAPALG